MIADTHISSQLDATVRGAHMVNNLKHIVSEILACSPDHILFNGDMAFDVGKSDDYRTFFDLVDPLIQVRIPLHFTLGNHDHRARFLEAHQHSQDSPVRGKWVSSQIDRGFCWIFLDSLHDVIRLSGELGRAQLDWLRTQLDAHDRHTVIICVHHPSRNTLAGLRDAGPFLECILPRLQVKAVLFGHKHVYRHWQAQGIHLVNLPAAGYPFNSLQPLRWLKATLDLTGMTLDFRRLKRGRQSKVPSLRLNWRAAR